MFDQAVRMGVGFFVGVWIARYLGPEQFGLLSFSIAFVGMFSIVAGLGLRGIVVRALLEEPDQKPEILGSAALLQLISGFLVYGLILGTIFWLRAGDDFTVRIVAILAAAVLFNFSDVATYSFEAEVASRYVVWARSIVYITFAVIKVGLILSMASLEVFGWTILAEAIAVAIALILIFRGKGMPVGHLRFSFRRAKSLLFASWPMILSGFALMVQAKVDQVMLGQLVGDREVAYYNSALRIVEAAAVFAIILKSSFMPHIMNSRKQSEDLFWGKLQKFYQLNAVVSVPICLCLILGSYPIIFMTFGDAYLPSTVVLSVMALRIIFTHLGAARGIFLLSEDLLRYSALTMIVGTLVNIGLNYFLIPSFGGVGATVASLISFFITIIGMDLLYRRTRRNAKLMLLSFFTFGSLKS